jgi:tripartite-type tricarboxylate transporter receptor subunit TctC
MPPRKAAIPRRAAIRLLAASIALPALGRAQQIAAGKPITLVVSYPAGGGADLIARLIAVPMGRFLGQNVVVDNRPGGSGQIAASLVARSAPDGSTLLVDASSFAVNPSLFPKLPYNSDTDFVPLGVVALFPNVLVCTPSFEAKSVADVIRLAKAKPAQIAYASSGNGSAQHLAGALFEERTGARLVHVPYKGGGPALNDVMGGQVPLFFANLASSLGHIQSGRLRPLAVTSKTRSAVLPDVPTMAEAGVPGYESYEWNPLLAPAGIDADTRRQLVAAVAHAMAAPEVQERILALGGEPFNGGAEAAEKFLQAQQQLWARIVRERNIKVE